MRFLLGQYSWNLLWFQKCESRSIFPPFIFKKKSLHENDIKNYKSVSSHQAVGSPLLIFPWSQTRIDKEMSLVVIQITQITLSWKQIYCFFCCRHKLNFYSNMSYQCHLEVPAPFYFCCSSLSSHCSFCYAGKTIHMNSLMNLIREMVT